jgi:hypothetical protein
MTHRKHKILTRYNAASLSEFQHYARGIPARQLCRILQRHERTVKTWLAGKAVIPPWTVAVLRLRTLEHELMKDQMGLTAIDHQQRAKNALHVIRRRPAANEGEFALQLRLDIA